MKKDMIQERRRCTDFRKDLYSDFALVVFDMTFWVMESFGKWDKANESACWRVKIAS